MFQLEIAMSLLLLLLAPAALAAPTARAAPQRRDGFQGACPVPASTFTIPQNFDALTSSPNLVLMGFGVQNYTCNSNKTFDNVGAVVQMFDVSCLNGQPKFATIQNDAFKIWNDTSETDPLSADIAKNMTDQFNLTVDGQHYFVAQNGSQNGTLSAVWDLTSSGPFKGNPDAIVFAHPVQTADSPDGTNNILWVELKKDSGQLADTIYRINTVEGQPPDSCNPGESKSVKFATKYLLL